LQDSKTEKRFYYRHGSKVERAIQDSNERGRDPVRDDVRSETAMGVIGVSRTMSKH
jgi:hypothetical protein